MEKNYKHFLCYDSDDALKEACGLPRALKPIDDNDTRIFEVKEWHPHITTDDVVTVTIVAIITDVDKVDCVVGAKEDS